jgi:hypothetical protein
MNKREIPDFETREIANGGEVTVQDDTASANALRGPVLIPRVVPISGQYQWKPTGITLEAVSEELRLDVDGSYPQMVASGVIRRLTFITAGVHWIANLTASGTKTWSGSIWFKDNLGGGGSLPVSIHERGNSGHGWRRLKSEAAYSYGDPKRRRQRKSRSRANYGISVVPRTRM